MNDNTRLTFEKYLITKRIPFEFNTYLNKYTTKRIQRDWEIWQASRESLIVELPNSIPIGDAVTENWYGMYYADYVKEALDKEGVKYK